MLSKHKMCHTRSCSDHQHLPEMEHPLKDNIVEHPLTGDIVEYRCDRLIVVGIQNRTLLRNSHRSLAAPPTLLSIYQFPIIINRHENCALGFFNYLSTRECEIRIKNKLLYRNNGGNIHHGIKSVRIGSVRF